MVLGRVWRITLLSTMATYSSIYIWIQQYGLAHDPRGTLHVMYAGIRYHHV